MKKILISLWKKDPHSLGRLLLLSLAVALTGSIGTVMLVPMLDLLQIPMEGMQGLLRPLAGLSYPQRAMGILAIFVLLMTAKALLTNRKALMTTAYTEDFVLELRQKLHKAILEADWEPLSKISHSELTNLLVSQCRQAKACLQEILILAESCASALLQLAIALWISPGVTAVVLGTGLVLLLLLGPFQKRSRQCGQQTIEASRHLHQELQNQLGSMKEIHAYGVEQENAQLFSQACQDYYALTLSAARLRALPQLLYGVSSAVLIALAFVISVLIFQTDAARLVILVYIFSRLWPVFSGWQSHLQRVQATLPAFEKLEEMTQRLTACRRPQKKEAPPAFGAEVAFDRVGFTYRDGREPVLEDVSFRLPFGSVTALVGPSGTGKTTVADLLMGLLHPTQGQILVDGVPLTEDGMASWRSTIGYVPQDPLLLDTSLRENLRRFHPQATEAEMLQALRDGQAWDFVQKLEKGLDTVVGTKGVGLSGGQRQRIVLARVLLGAPKLIILDEATSALDYESEAQFRQVIDQLKGKATVLIIAHRLATIRSADRAIVLDKGTVAESGPLAELLERKDGYLAGMLTLE